MTINPFDDENGSFFVLVNDAGQHSLWPDFAAVPAGWQVMFGAAARPDCLEYVERHWPGIMPKGVSA